MENFIYFKNLLKSYQNNKNIPYAELLSTYEWHEFRGLIIERDNRKCVRCNLEGSKKSDRLYTRKLTEEEEIAFNEKYKKHNKEFEDSPFKLKFSFPTGVIDENPVILHVHHTYYIDGYLPWTYNSDSLITVCQKCHNEIHQSTIIPVYKNKTKAELLKLTPCEKCHGTGFIEKFYYYQEGVCFACMGNRFKEYCV